MTHYHPVMILAYHLIISAYGFWLPNDPRGSWSEFVRAYELYLAGGPATKIDTRRSVAHHPTKHEQVRKTQNALKRRPVRFHGRQAKAIVDGFADYCERNHCIIHACAVLPDHAHLVVARGHMSIEGICNRLKAAGTTSLTDAGLHPFADQPLKSGRLPTPWAQKGWWVFIDSEAVVVQAVRYVENNPVKAGLKRQRWSFITPLGV